MKDRWNQCILKHGLTAILLAGVLFAGATRLCGEEPEQNVVAWWSLDGEEAGAVPDRSGNAYDAIISGQPVFEQGIHGQALSLSPRDPAWLVVSREFGEFEAGITIELCFRAKVPQQNAHLLNATGGAGGFRILVDRGADLVWQVPGQEGFSNICRSSLPLQDGRWYHLAVTYDGAKTLMIYLDGVERGKLELREPALVTPRRKMVFGAFDEKGTLGTFEGLLDEVRIFNRALTPEEVENRWNAVQSRFDEL